MPFVTVQGRRLEYELLSARERSAPAIVLLHEGLGSLALWRDFPARVAEATGAPVLVYSRYGYGRSAPLAEKRPIRFMHEEALQALPELLDSLAIERPVLLGHSDGASIALIHAGGAGRPVAGVIAMAPHVMVEEYGLASIRRAKQDYATTDLRARLARYHADPDSAFRGWNDVWLDPQFVRWNIEEYLPGIRCPVLAIQGEQDEYGTMEQIERIARHATNAPKVELLKLPDCRHSPHRDQPQAVLDAVARFLRELREARATGS